MKFKYPTYLVGGAVRDKIMGKTPKDLDYSVVCPSFDAMEKMLLSQRCEIYLSSPEFLTIRAKHPDLGPVDFAVARRDGDYSDGRRPDNTFVAGCIEDDLSRRDATMNAIAENVETGEIIDPFNGRGDIKNGIVRAVGDPGKRLAEDALRAFRYFRFGCVLNFALEKETLGAIRSMGEDAFKGVSPERIREELKKAFEKKPEVAFLALGYMKGLLFAAFEAGVWFEPSLKERN